MNNKSLKFILHRLTRITKYLPMHYQIAFGYLAPAGTPHTSTSAMCNPKREKGSATTRTKEPTIPLGTANWYTGCTAVIGADSHRLRQYVQRWVTWLHGGLQGAVTENRFNQIWDYVNLKLSGLTEQFHCIFSVMLPVRSSAIDSPLK